MLFLQNITSYSNVKTSNFYRWTHIGFIPHVKLGRFVRFKEHDVLKWIELKSNNGRTTKNIDIH
ncbi:MAG TPA: hypothetical protein DCZ43_01125 [candidate division Zixibacteria bacterium]|nr:hypothetical protein [candidate division Zixibacteria bacterium]